MDHAEFAQLFLASAYGDENPAPPAWAQALCVAEEAGEFVGAFRRSTGWARREGSVADMQQELADVVITAYVFAAMQRFDLDAAIRAKRQVILSRGFGTTANATA